MRPTLLIPPPPPPRGEQQTFRVLEILPYPTCPDLGCRGCGKNIPAQIDLVDSLPVLCRDCACGTWQGRVLGQVPVVPSWGVTLLTHSGTGWANLLRRPKWKGS